MSTASTDPELGFMENACGLLRHSEVCRRWDIPADHITAHGKADNHRSLMVARRRQWRVPCTDGRAEGLEGVEVHYESRRPGDWRIDCELAPRIQNPSRHSSELVKSMLDLKAFFTEELRKIARDEGWDELFGAHTRRAMKDPRDPSSLMVVAFDTGLGERCTPEQFVAVVEPIIDATAPFIDELVTDRASI